MRLGGRKRVRPLTVEELTNLDLEEVNLDVRSNADRIYQEVFEEFTSVGDTNRNLQPEWITEAREDVRSQQKMVIQDLEEKIKLAPVVASDEFMYQDKEESQRELEVARSILAESPTILRGEKLASRTWNILPYKRYRGSDEPEDGEV